MIKFMKIKKLNKSNTINKRITPIHKQKLSNKN